MRYMLFFQATAKTPPSTRYFDNGCAGFDAAEEMVRDGMWCVRLWDQTSDTGVPLFEYQRG